MCRQEATPPEDSVLDRSCLETCHCLLLPADSLPEKGRGDSKKRELETRKNSRSCSGETKAGGACDKAGQSHPQMLNSVSPLRPGAIIQQSQPLLSGVFALRLGTQCCRGPAQGDLPRPNIPAA